MNAREWNKENPYIMKSFAQDMLFFSFFVFHRQILVSQDEFNDQCSWINWTRDTTARIAYRLEEENEETEREWAGKNLFLAQPN